MGNFAGQRNCRRGARRAAQSGAWLAFVLAGVVGGFAADLTVALEPRWGRAPVTVPSAEVANTAGQPQRITRLAALISEVTLQRTDGAVVRLEGQCGAIDVGEGRRSFTLQGVPEGEYLGLAFVVGVPADLNHGDPGRWPATHPLNPLVNGLHWSWQGGYVFAAFEGTWGGPSGERGFVYHIATDAHRLRVAFAAGWTVQGPTTVTLALDLSRVLGARTLVADEAVESTHSGAGDTLAPELAAALERAWFWLEAAPTPFRGPGAGTNNPGVPRRVSGGTSGGAATPLAFTVPAGFPQPELPSDNPLSVDGVALGAALFVDARLSGNGTQSCASCHLPDRAFGDRVAFSRGSEGTRGRRNAMPLFNLAWNPAFAWDGSRPRIRDQALAAWTNPIEMHGEPSRVVAVLAGDLALAARFAVVFGDATVTPERVTLALEQYLLTLVAADAKFDRAMRGAAELSAEEQRGFELFSREFDPARGLRGADCFHCHGGILFSDYAAKNNGLDRESADPGRATVTGQATDRGKFKTPSLRNVALTAPYMHDGRFATLEDVVSHYDHGVRRGANLDPNLAKHPDAGLGLSAEDQRALVAFLRTLTESSAGSR